MHTEILNNISRLIGAYFENEKVELLNSKVSNIIKELDLKNEKELEYELAKSNVSQEVISSVAKHITIGETYFFRDPNTLNAIKSELQKIIANKLNRGEQRLKIWSAGCSSGEEIYTSLMMLGSMLPDSGKWNLFLLATDINPSALEKTKNAVYGKWSFRGNNNLHNSKYFESIGNSKYKIKDDYRQKVTVRFHNLVDNLYPAPSENIFDFDLIFCRNVLMYFKPETRETVIHKLHSSLAQSGILCLSPSESSIPPKDKFDRIEHNDTFLFRKKEEGSTEAAKDEIKIGSSFDRKNLRIPPKTRKLPTLKKSPAKITTAKKAENKVKVERQVSHEFNKQLKLLYSNNKYSEVETCFEKLDESDKKKINNIELYARACANQRKFDQAVSKLNEIIKKDRTKASYHFLLGNLLFEMGKIDEAIKAFQTANYLDEEHIESLTALGNIYINQAQKKRAKEYLNHALYLLQSLPPDQKIDELDETTVGDYLKIVSSLLEITV